MDAGTRPAAEQTERVKVCVHLLDGTFSKRARNAYRAVRVTGCVNATDFNFGCNTITVGDPRVNVSRQSARIGSLTTCVPQGIEVSFGRFRAVSRREMDKSLRR